jgi:hypothetical protein
MEILKKIDWKGKGVDLVRWEIAMIPDGITQEEFIAQKESDGWEVTGIMEDVIGRKSIFIEIDAKIYDNKFKEKGDVIK